MGSVVSELCRTLKLAATPGQPGVFHYIGGRVRPALDVSLRTIDPNTFSIIDDSTGQELERIEARNAFWEVYDGAVYLFHGRPYLCKHLDLTSRVAHVVASDVRYYTKTIDFKDIHVVGGRLAYDVPAKLQFPATSCRVSDAVVTQRFTGFHRLWRGTGIAFDAVDLFLPDVQFMTVSAYVRCVYWIA
jgi:DEAD/DEAH box helicase domain-containing protein